MRYPLANWQSRQTGYRYGDRTFYNTGHIGIDKIVPTGAVVYAPTDGNVVARIPHTQSPTGGNTVHFVDNQGHLWRFMHLESFSAWSGKVKEGLPIGFTGNTGLSSGPHLHVDISPTGSIPSPIFWENFLDPEAYMEKFRMYEGTIIRNIENGSYAFVLNGKRREIHADRSGLAALTAMQRKTQIQNVSAQNYDAIPKGQDF